MQGSCTIRLYRWFYEFNKLNLPPKTVVKPSQIDKQSFLLACNMPPQTEKHVLCAGCSYYLCHELHLWEPRLLPQWNKWKALRFTELSHETKLLNMVTEGLSSQIPKPTMPWENHFTLHSRRNVYVYSISAILYSGVARNIRQQRQPAVHFAVKVLLNNIHKSCSCAFLHWCSWIDRHVAACL